MRRNYESAISNRIVKVNMKDFEEINGYYEFRKINVVTQLN